MEEIYKIEEMDNKAEDKQWALRQLKKVTIGGEVFFAISETGLAMLNNWREKHDMKKIWQKQREKNIEELLTP